METLIAKLYTHGIIPAKELPRASRVAGTTLENVLQELERMGVPRNVVYADALTTTQVIVSGWQPFTYDEAVAALYNRAVSLKELAAQIGKSPKAITNFRWRAFKQGFIVPKSIWQKVVAGEDVKEYGWRGEFALMLWELTKYAKARKLTPPKVMIDETQ